MIISAKDGLKGQEKLLNRISGIIILLNVVLIGIESSNRGNIRNTFLAVMTSGIQDRLAKEKNQKPLGQMPENSNLQQEIASLKKSIKTLQEVLGRKKD
ncbi:MAG: hypothetical protein FJZ80_04730 [Bacteroidetes bacterium]|nr:hypothetical protein [Bacteroidota bacterium]MBM3424165.1 hypothetical protein [Bacteroidota bacterium]